jgi:hypothetical protein
MKCCVAASMTWPVLVSARKATTMTMPMIATVKIFVACSAATPPEDGRACSRPCGRLRVAKCYLLDSGYRQATAQNSAAFPPSRRIVAT